MPDSEIPMKFSDPLHDQPSSSLRRRRFLALVGVGSAGVGAAGAGLLGASSNSAAEAALTFESPNQSFSPSSPVLTPARPPRTVGSFEPDARSHRTRGWQRRPLDRYPHRQPPLWRPETKHWPSRRGSSCVRRRTGTTSWPCSVAAARPANRSRDWHRTSRPVPLRDG